MTKHTVVDPKFYDFATERQKEYLRAIEETGSRRAAAKKMGVASQVVDQAYNAVKKRAAKQGWSPDHDMVQTVPDGFLVKGTSTYYRKDEETGDWDPKGQWVKSAVDRERQIEIIEETIKAMCETMPRLEALPAPDLTMPDLLNVYTMTDCHMGMLAWKDETGADWDLEIGEKVLTGCFAHMIDSSPAAESCVVAQLGDFLHYDGLEALTPTSGHILDADSRFGKLVAVAARTLRGLVDMALAKHKHVYVLMAEGNHDMASSVWLRTMFAMLYENEPRVTMIHHESPYYAMQWGRTMIGWHHGHKKGLDPSTGLMFAERNKEMFGTTDWRYIHFGDKHHWAGKEVAGFYLEQHPTLAAPDAYAARGGWDSKQKVVSITYHNVHGEACRFTTHPAMLAGQL